MKKRYPEIVMHDFRVSFLSNLLSPITIKTGIDFLESWHGIATGNIRTSRQEGESVLLKLSRKNFNDICDSAAVIGKLFDGIFEKQPKCCCLLRINQLLHVAEIDILFSDQETIFSMYFYFELFRSAGVSSVGTDRRCLFLHDAMALRESEFRGFDGIQRIFST